MSPRIQTKISDSWGEDGFSLAEVIVAVAILGTLATASLYLTVGGLNSSESQRRSNVAITLAGNAMESVVAQSPAINAVSGVSAVYNGRAHADTVASWAANASIAGVDRMYPGWQPGIAAGSTPAIPFTNTVTVNGTEYSVQTMIGRCYQPLAGGQCTTLPGHAVAPAIPPTGQAELTRITTVVWWFAGANCASGCTYSASTLVDTSEDLPWFGGGSP